MKPILLSLLIGYLIGTLNPAALLSRVKHKNLREHGTGNLGASNALLVFGRVCGAIVMLFDIAKAFAAVKLAQILFPAYPTAGLLAGSAAVVGHIYPFYLKFKGGKGLAAFGGMVLGYDPVLFLILLAVGCVFMLLFNYGIALTLSASAAFPFLNWLRSESLTVFLISFAVSLLIILKHIGVLKRVLRGEDVKIRSYIKNQLFH